VSIIPSDEKILVSHQLNLKATPAKGPPTNLMVAAKATAKYSEILSIYNRNISFRPDITGI
jgi:hypothetical protein